MSDKPISVGDLVQIARPRPCCGTIQKFFGDTFVVTNLMFRTETECWNCRDASDILLAEGHPQGLYDIRSLKRIPPPEELGIVDEREELHA